MADEIIQSSVQRKPEMDDVKQIVLHLSSAYDQIVPTWWSPRRDAFFRNFWIQEPILASAIYSISARNAAFGWDLSGLSDDVWQAQRLLQFADFGGGWQQLITKTTIDTLTCLAGQSTVMLGGDRRGKRKSVRDMVKNKDVGPVLSVEKDGSISERRVVGWHKSPLMNRHWMWLRLKRASFHGGKKPGGIYLTDDHKINTRNGWKRADELSVGDSVYTGYPEPNEKQNQLIVGTLLGDASMSMKHGESSALLRFLHCAQQEEWLDIKISSLRGFGWTPKTTREQKQFGGNAIQLNSHCTPGLSKTFMSWYPDGKKHIPLNIVKEAFSPIMLAAWYLDDGSMHRNKNRNGDENRPGISLYTNGFEKEEVEELVSILSNNGFDASLHITKENGKTYPTIYLGVNSAELFYRTIAKYVPPTMRYKLPENIYSLDDYDSSAWDLGNANSYIDEVETITYKDYSSGYKTVETAYCLDVEETHNFSVCGVNVHNCDNGAFWEIIRPAHVTLDGLTLPAVKQYLENNERPEWFAVYPDNKKVRLRDRDVKLFDSPLDLPIAIAHLDSARVQRTGNPEIPAIYTDVDGKMHRMRWWQIAMFSDMPSPIEEMNGVGTSALSRIFRHAHTLQSLSVYKDEKLSGRFTRSVYITNADPQLIQDQIEQASNAADNVGLQRYSQPVIASTFDPGATPTIAKIDLAQMPDGFDEATTLEWYVSVLALALGVDYGFLAPLPGKGLGTASQSETMARQSRGKSSRLFMDMTANTINFKGILPESVRFRYIERDTEEELAIERVKQMRAETRAIMVKSGEISSQIARQIASDDGDLPERYLSVIGEQDITPEIQVAGDDNYNAQQAVNEAGSNSLLTEEIISEETPPTEESIEQEPIIGVAMLRKGRSFDQKAIAARRATLLSSVPLVTKISNAARKAIGKKQPTELDHALETYKDELEDLARAVSDGTIETDAFVESLASKSALTLNAMFALGYGADDFVRDERLDKMIDINELSASKFGTMIDAYEGDLLDSSLRRLALWMSDAAHAYYLGKVTNPEKQEQRYKFVNGATSDHCDDCVRLDGQVHTASEWDEHSDMLPRSHALKCAGFRCMCELEETDEATNGNF